VCKHKATYKTIRIASSLEKNALIDTLPPMFRQSHDGCLEYVYVTAAEEVNQVTSCSSEEVMLSSGSS